MFLGRSYLSPWWRWGYSPPWWRDRHYPIILPQYSDSHQWLIYVLIDETTFVTTNCLHDNFSASEKVHWQCWRHDSHNGFTLWNRNVWKRAKGCTYPVSWSSSRLEAFHSDPCKQMWKNVIDWTYYTVMTFIAMGCPNVALPGYFSTSSISQIPWLQ